MSDYANWYSITKNSFKDFEFEAKLSYYKSFDFIEFDSSISSQYNDYVNTATNDSRQAKSIEKDIEDLEKDIDDTEYKHKIDARDPANADITFWDVLEARKKWQLTLPFTEEAKKAHTEYTKLLYKYQVRQPYDADIYQENLDEKKKKLLKKQKKLADAKQEAIDAQKAIEKLTEEMDKQFEELDKIIDLRLAMLKGVKRANGDGSYSYEKIDYINEEPLKSNIAVSSTFINSTKKIFVTRGKPLTQENMPEIFDSCERIKTLLTDNQESLLHEVETNRADEFKDYVEKFKEDRERD